MRQWMMATIEFLTLYLGEWSIRSTHCNRWWHWDSSLHTTKKMTMHGVGGGSDESEPKKFKPQLSVNKVTRTDFWDWIGSLYEEYLPYKKDESITRHRYFDTLLHLHNAIRWKWLELLSKGVVFIHDNATPHKAALLKRLLVDFDGSVFLHPLFSLDLILIWFHAVFDPKECSGQKAVSITRGGKNVCEVISRQPWHWYVLSRITKISLL